MANKILKMVVQFVLFACVTSMACAENKDTTVIGQINGDKIYKWEAEAVISSLANEKNMKEKPIFDHLNKDEKLAIIKEIAVKKLLKDAVKDSGIEKDKEVKEKIQHINDELVQNEFLSRQMKKDVTHDMVKTRYNELVKENTGKEELRIRHILVGSEKEANVIYKGLVKSPSAFAAVAKKKSLDKTNNDHGGEIGFFVPGSGILVKELENAAMKLKPGGISKPVKTSFGWHVIQLQERRKIMIPTFDAVKDKVEQDMQQKAIQAYLKGLLEKAKLTVAEK